MITKRHFLMGSATAVAASPSLALDAGKHLAATLPHLDAEAGLATWQAFVGQDFQIGEATVKLAQATARDATGLQFSLYFEPVAVSRPAEGLLALKHPDAESFQLLLAGTRTGLRADFCRSSG
jgi:hypothetical protein